MDYRAWLQSDPSKSWALNYVGNDYNAPNAGINVSKLWSDTRSSNPVGTEAYLANKTNTLKGFANEYASYLNSQGNGSQPDNSAPSTGNVYDTSGSSGGSSAAAAAAAQQREVDYTRSMLDTNLGSLRGLLGNIGQTRDQGVSQYDTTYNNKQVEGNARYGQQETDNMQDRQKALGRVDTNARTAANSLKRLLGLSGSANQSALKFAAPNAISRVASGERQEQLDNFGRNQRNITNEKTSFLDGLKNEYEQGKGNFLRSLYEQENDINSKIGEIEMQKAALNGSNYDGIRAAYAPFQSTIDQNTQRISDIFNQYKPNLKTNANLAKTESYNVDKAAIGANQSLGGDEYSPYAQFLKRKMGQVA